MAGYERQISRILREIKKYEPNANLNLIRKAFSYEAEKIREFKEQDSPLKKLNVAHCSGIANALVNMKLSQEMVLAGILHDSPSLGAPISEIRKLFGAEVATLLEKRHKLLLATSKESENKLEQRKRLIFTIAGDLGQVLIELANTLDRLKNYEHFPKKEREAFMEYASSIYIPLAHKLGIRYIITNMEDLVFKYTEPEVYTNLVRKVRIEKKRQGKETNKIKKILRRKISERETDATITSRIKHIFAIHRKMQRKNRSFNEIYDINAIRVITKSISECYEILGTVHSLWRPIAEEFDDYIAKPKDNGYQSIHTTIISEDGKPIEIQIRTEEMNDYAELGVAAHWQYKGHGREHHDKKLSWMKEVLDWQKRIGELKPLDINLFKGEIRALTPKGDMVELPKGATALDFAFEVHSEIGHRCKSIKVRGKIVPLDFEIDNGDTVEIILAKTQQTKAKWLNIVKTEKAKNRIKQRLKIKPVAKTRHGKEAAFNISKADSRIRLAKCCSPVPGDNVIGYITTKRKISVHRGDCEEGIKINQNRNMVEVDWGAKTKEEFPVKIEVRAIDRVGLLKDILNVFYGHGINVWSAGAKADQKGNINNCFFEIRTRDLKQLQLIMGEIEKVNSVLKVSRHR